LLAVATAVAVLAGCGAGAGVALDIAPGISRAETKDALSKYEYCRKAGPVRPSQTYETCSGPGVTYGHSWVVAEFDGDTLTQLQRWERFSDPERATDRWHELVTKRAEINGPPSDRVREKLRNMRGVPANAISWAAFASTDFSVVIGVYLLEAVDSDDPNILEEILIAPPSEDAP
jgi:hypothetical protein